MSQFPIDRQPPRSLLRRWNRAPVLGTLGLIIALIGVGTLVNVAPDQDDDAGVAGPPPPCADPGPREPVEPGALEEQLWRDVDRVGIAAVSPRRRDVDGARGWRFTLVLPMSESLIWVFVKHTARIQLVCRWTDLSLRARIVAGCDQLVDTLTVA